MTGPLSEAVAGPAPAAALDVGGLPAIAPAESGPSTLRSSPTALRSGSAALASGLEDRAADWIDAAGGPWQYLLVFVLAAIPLLEVLVVIPIGIALGLDPVAVAGLAFAGNALSVYGLVVAHERLSARFSARESDGSDRRRRARRIWNAYGLPGLAALAPIATGVHLAAIVALGLGARARPTLCWMTVSIAAWTVVIAAGAVAGASVLTGLA